MFIDDLAVLLVTAGVAKLNVSLFLTSKATIPPGPGPYLSIISTGGSGVEYVQNQKSPAYAMPSAQLVARAAAAEVAETMALAAFNAVTGIVNQTVNGVWYLSITPLQSEPFDMGLDAKDRIRIGFNVMAKKKPA